MKMGWAWAFEGNEQWEPDTYTTKEDAIKAAIDQWKSFADYNELPSITIDVGEIKPSYIRDFFPHPDSIIESIQDKACDEVGDHNWLEKLTKEEVEDLKNNLNNLLQSWIERYALHPDFVVVPNIKTVIITNDLSCIDERTQKLIDIGTIELILVDK